MVRLDLKIRVSFLLSLRQVTPRRELRADLDEPDTENVEVFPLLFEHSSLGQ